MKIEYINTELLIPYINNSRIHSEKQIDQIAASIKEFGFLNPIIVDKDNGIIAGHGRLIACSKLNIEEVPCIRAEHLTESQKKAYIIADNKIAENAEWDNNLLKIEIENLKDLAFDIDLLAFDDTELNDILGIEEDEIEIIEDDYDIKPPEEPKAKMGQIYQLGNHRLMCGDSTNKYHIEKLINNKEMDLCVTDPPYNVNYGSINESGYGKQRENGNKILNDNMDDLSFYNFLHDFYTQMFYSLKNGGSFYIFHADTEGYNFRKALKDAGGVVKQNLIWVKNSFVLGRQDYQWKHEPCLYGWKEGAGHYFIDCRNKTTIIEDEGLEFEKMKKNDLVKLLQEIYSEKTLSTIIHEDKPMKNDLHPTMKPIKLISKLIINSSKENENVIDFFGGSGSTLITCEQLNRNCYTIELDPKYVDVIIDRWETFTGEKATLIQEV